MKLNVTQEEVQKTTEKCHNWGNCIIALGLEITSHCVHKYHCNSKILINSLIPSLSVKDKQTVLKI